MEILKEQFFDALSIFFLTLATILMIVFAVLYDLSQPDVIFSYETKQCVRVDLPDGGHGDCNNLPRKYHAYWGK